ncbi:MAG TPA: glutathione S-transferase family protein [Alphaproteobacteria bacterium]|nr:glutathione S-transferase family protein [Alphaproteobacteria bacterium]
MSMLVDGKWQDGDATTRDVAKDGRFKRVESKFRNWVTADGSSGFAAEPGRYHLYAAYSCPWAHRALMFRKLKKLDNVISVSIAAPGMRDQGWTFVDHPDFPECGPDTVNGYRYLHQAYSAADPRYTGRVTVPTLWDKKKRTVVNNESSEIIRMFNSAFDAYTNEDTDFYPEALRLEIDAVNKLTYDNVNNGVYRCGFATSQAAYEEAYDQLFGALDELEARLGRQRYLVGKRITEADWRLFPTLVRFDVAYFSLFKCNKRRIVDYPNLINYTRELHQVPGIAETVKVAHFKRGYWSMARLNPSGVIPKGPELTYDAPHDRARFPAV